MNEENLINLAIIDDDINMRKSLQSSLELSKENFKISAYKSAKEAIDKLDDEVDLLIVDINMPKMSGIELLEHFKGKYEAIIITGNTTLDLTIKAMRAGASDFLQKPFEIKDLLNSIKRISSFKKRTKSKTILKENNSDFYGTSPKLEYALKLSKKTAKTDASALLLGESGVGKELFANFIHKNSTRANAPFIAVNMAAIPSNLIESELFGYEKGAFTDAVARKIGKFEMAHGGSIFLDEIAELPIELQAKLLRALQEKEIHRLGGDKTIKIDIRIISATNANLEESIKNGTFREDLFYRINTIPIIIPPLRERKNEITTIANKVLEQCSKMYQDIGEKTLSKEAIEALLAYKWPGNIRELKSVIERSFILSEESEISKDDLFINARESSENKSGNVNELENNLYQEAYELSNQDIKACAKILDIDEKLARKKLEKFKII